MRKLFIFFLMITAVMHAQTGQFVPEMAALDESIQQFMTQWNIPGGSVAVAKNGRLVYARGFGFADTSTDELVQPTHRFRMASLSKPITATAIYHLVEEGKLSLQDHVFGQDGILNDDEFLPLHDERFADITIKQLLGHQGGTHRFGGNNDPMFSPISIAESLGIPPPAFQNDIIRYMATTQNLEYTPGEDQVYSNFGYAILGRVIEHVTNKDYETYIKEEMMSELGAPSFNITKNLLADRQTNEVHYYDNASSSLFPSIYGTGELVPGPYGGVNVEAMDSHGGWIATATDMLKFGLAIDGFSTRPDFISSSSIQTMRSYPVGFSNFGHGILLYGGGAYHFGILPGASAELDLNDYHQIAFVALFNSQSYNSSYVYSLDSAIWNGLVAVTNWPDHDLFEPISATPTVSPMTISVYPNPATDFIWFEFDHPTTFRFDIYDLTNKQIAHLQVDNATQKYQWQRPKNFVPGIYLVHIITDEGQSINKKIIILE